MDKTSSQEHEHDLTVSGDLYCSDCDGVNIRRATMEEVFGHLLKGRAVQLRADEDGGLRAAVIGSAAPNGWLISDQHITFSKYEEPQKSQVVIRGTVRLAVEIAIPVSDLAELGDVSIAILGGKAGVKIEEALRADPLKYLVRLGEYIQRLEAPRLLTRGEGDTE